MTKNVFAFTAAGSNYPEYVSVNETDDPDKFTITVRSASTKRQGCYVCGQAIDKGQPGRCTPGDDHCNNYCNMAPQKGAMQDAPLSCEHVCEGPSAIITLTMQQVDQLAAAILRATAGQSV